MVTNGGFGSDAAHAVLTYRWIVGKYGQSTADTWASSFMPTFQINAAKTPGSNPTVEGLVTAMQYVLNWAELDYINIHRYEASTTSAITPNMHRYIKEWVEETYKRPYIINETGQWGTTDATQVTNLMNEFKRLRITYVQWWDGTGTFAYPLTDGDTGAIFDNGIAFRDFVAANNELS
jgi:hypothetical protein